MARSIRIGRDDTNDWVIPQMYDTVSNFHADIQELPNGHLLFVDHSRNGTTINGQKINHTNREIRYGDSIRIANSCSLSWTEISRFFPNVIQRNYQQETKPYSRETELHNIPSDNWAVSEHERRNESNSWERDKIEKAKSEWNWGAFLLHWIWGIGHGIWWPCVVMVSIGLLSLLLLPLVPFLSIVNWVACSILSMGICIYLGIKGNAMAWDNGCYNNYAHFVQKERNWTIAGLIVWGLFLLSVILIYYFLWASLILFIDSLY